MFSPEIMLQPPDGDQWAAIDQLSWPSLDTFDFDGGFVHDANQPDGIKLEERSAISGSPIGTSASTGSISYDDVEWLNDSFDSATSHLYGGYQPTIFRIDGYASSGISTDKPLHFAFPERPPPLREITLTPLDIFDLSQELSGTTWPSENEGLSSTPSLTWSPIHSIPSSSRELTPNLLSQFPVTTLFDCNWKDCPSSDLCSTIESHRSHLKCHAETAREDWKCQHKSKKSDGGIKCTWKGCATKARYKSEKLFEQHLVNIHINPLVCTAKQCKHTKPFRANHDLQRHIATAHSATSKYCCPFTLCSVKPSRKGFSRKDKWMKHLHDHHDTEPCPYAHCLDDSFVGCPGKSTATHIAKMHGTFECGLSSCNKGKVSGFSDAALSEHLQVSHNIEWAIVLKARDCAKAKGDSTLRNEHLPEVPPPHECKSCFTYEL